MACCSRCGRTTIIVQHTVSETNCLVRRIGNYILIAAICTTRSYVGLKLHCCWPGDSCLEPSSGALLLRLPSCSAIPSSSIVFRRFRYFHMGVVAGICLQIATHLVCDAWWFVLGVCCRCSNDCPLVLPAFVTSRFRYFILICSARTR